MTGLHDFGMTPAASRLSALSAIVLSATCLIGGAALAQTPPPAPAGTGFPGGIWTPGPARYGVERTEVQVRMDDGTMLAARVSRPTNLATGQPAPGPFTVIIEHTPYTVAEEHFTYFTERGYIFAEVRARGTGASAGEVQYSGLRDGLDGKAVVNWASGEIGGSDGRVALIGCSYPAAMGLRTASVIGPGSPLKAMVAACNGFSSQNRGAFLRGGLQVQQMSIFLTLQGLLGNTDSSIRYFQQGYDDITSGGPIAYEREFWNEKHDIEIAPAVAASTVPILFWTGWQDPVEGAIRSYTTLQNIHAGRPPFGPMAPDQQVTPRYQLIVGDWGHSEGLDPGVYLQWIETWLNGTDTGIQNTTTPVHTADPGLGTDVFSNIAGFPLATTSTPWFMSGTELSTTAPAAEGTLQVTWQAPDLPGGKVALQTPAFASGTTLSGPISATIYASSSNTNLMLVGKLYDVAPDGTAVEITTGPILGSQSDLDPDKTWTDAAGTRTFPWPLLFQDHYLTPDEVGRFDLALLIRHCSVKPGHSLRLELTGQTPAALCDGPGQARSRGADVCFFTPQQQQTLAGGVYTIHTGGERPSALNLPQIAFGSVPTVPAALVPSGTATPDDERRVLPLEW